MDLGTSDLDPLRRPRLLGLGAISSLRNCTIQPVIGALENAIGLTVGIGYCDYHLVTNIGYCDFLPALIWYPSRVNIIA